MARKRRGREQESRLLERHFGADILINDIFSKLGLGVIDLCQKYHFSMSSDKYQRTNVDERLPSFAIPKYAKLRLSGDMRKQCNINHVDHPIIMMDDSMTRNPITSKKTNTYYWPD